MHPTLRTIAGAGLTAALTVSVAWASAGLAPVAHHGDDLATGRSTVLTDAAPSEPAAPSAPTVAGADAASATTRATAMPGAGEVLAGAAKVSITPRPADYDGTWETDHDACATLSESEFQRLAGNPGDAAHLADVGSPWPENPNCIYMGGFGIGPMNPVSSFDPVRGLWVRAFAVRDADGDTAVLTVLDGEGYFWDYASKCDDCGIEQLSARLGQKLGIDPAGIVIAATHSHAGPDFIGGWGFVPDWYMQQVADSIEQAVTDAVGALRPAVLEVGEQRARPYNHERRDTYHSAEEQQLTWLRALAIGRNHKPDPDDVIATIGAYAAHPTTRGTNDGVADADWPGVFEQRLEQRFGGVGLHFMTGLGNMSASGSTEDVGTALADLVPDPGAGHRLTDTDLRATRTTWRQPATNVPLTALAVPGFFDHQFDPVPASVRTGPKPDTAPCASSSPYSVSVPAAAIRIGQDFALTTAPGEVFSNFSNTVKEKSGALVTMPLGQANDALGYMPQSFELNPVGQQGLGFAVSGYLVVNYEDSYSIDRCFGDMALETTLGLLHDLS